MGKGTLSLGWVDGSCWVTTGKALEIQSVKDISLNPDDLSCWVIVEHLMICMASSQAFLCCYPYLRDIEFVFPVLAGEDWSPNGVSADALCSL